MGLNLHELKNIEQVIVNNGQRMTYSSAFKIAKDKKLAGYIVISNSDIFFDKSLLNIRRSSLSIVKSVYALMRFEYTGQNNLNNCKIFGYHPTSQDVWIIHSKYLPTYKDNSKFNIYLGCKGCDNAVAYRLYKNKYKLFNEPFLVKTYHNHKSNVRTSTVRNSYAPRPYLHIQIVKR